MERPSSRPADGGPGDGGGGPGGASIGGQGGDGHTSPSLEPQAASGRTGRSGSSSGDRRKSFLCDDMPSSTSPAPYRPKLPSVGRSLSWICSDMNIHVG